MISGDKLSYKSHQLGTSVHRKNVLGESPTLFLYQAERDGSLQHCHVLLNLGIYVNSLEADGRKALFYAVQYEKKDIIELLLNKEPM
jgi:ankyrin repeat protein